MIKAILTSYYSKCDKYGKCYWAFAWVDTKTGQQVVGVVCGGEGNITAIVRCMGLSSNEVHYGCDEMAIRDFDRLVKYWSYAGCEPEELAQFIRDSLT